MQDESIISFAIRFSTKNDADALLFTIFACNWRIGFLWKRNKTILSTSGKSSRRKFLS